MGAERAKRWRFGGQWSEEARRIDPGVHVLRARQAPLVNLDRSVAVDQMADQRAFLQEVSAIDQILPHQILGEREGAEHDLGRYLEAGDVPHCRAHDAPNSIDVDAALVLGQVAVEAGDTQLEILAQQLEQGEVETWLVLMRNHRDARERALALKPDRQQDQRRAIGLFLSGRLLPLQEAEREIEGVGPAFLSAITVTLLKAEGAPLAFVPVLRAALLAGAAIWSL